MSQDEIMLFEDKKVFDSQDLPGIPNNRKISNKNVSSHQTSKYEAYESTDSDEELEPEQDD